MKQAPVWVLGRVDQRSPSEFTVQELLAHHCPICSISVLERKVSIYNSFIKRWLFRLL